MESIERKDIAIWLMFVAISVLFVASLNLLFGFAYRSDEGFILMNFLIVTGIIVAILAAFFVVIYIERPSTTDDVEVPYPEGIPLTDADEEILDLLHDESLDVDELASRTGYTTEVVEVLVERLEDNDMVAARDGRYELVHDPREADT